jgi:hypothetical protein
MSNSSRKALAVNVVLLLAAALWTSRVEAGTYVKSVTCPHASVVVVQPSSVADCDPGTSPLDFSGSIHQEITEQGVDSEGHSYAKLQVTSFQMTANHPLFGRIQLSLDTTRPGAVSTLRSVNPGSDFPVIHTTRLYVTGVADSLPGVVLQSQGDPVEFVGNPSNTWPPTANVYTLQKNVVFEDRAHPGTALITACAGAVGVTGSETH